MQKISFVQTSKIKLFVFITLIEVICIIILLTNLSQKNQSHILGAEVHIEPIKSQDYIYPKNTYLKSYYIPVTGYVRREQISWSNKSVAYHLNNEGFNNFKDFAIEKPHNVFRILTLGDSYTFGLYVNTSENYPTLLETTLNTKQCTNLQSYEVINLGVPGYDIEYSLERFKQQGLKYNPDLVIWFIKFDDFFQVNEAITQSAREIKQKMEKSGEFKESEAQGKYFPHLFKAQNDYVSKNGIDKILKEQMYHLELFTQLFKGKLLMVTFPDQSELYNENLYKFSRSKPNIFYNDRLPILKQNIEMFPDTHPNEDGYKKITQNINDFIDANSLITCNK